jgi:hypothetical protein
MTEQRKWNLEKGSRKWHCPECKKKTLKRYQWEGTTDYVGDDFGRCDRENNCGYHRLPNKEVSEPLTPNLRPKLPPPTQLFPNGQYLEKIRKARDTNFHGFMIGLGIPDSHLEKWGVGGHWKFTTFESRDVNGVVLNVKHVAYTAEGKRDKSVGTGGEPQFIPYYLGKSYLKNQKIETDAAKLEDWQDYYRFARCFYGEHLWDKEKDTCLVESEKTAVVASYFFPEYNWLATGGNNGMLYEQFELFYGYKGRIWNIVDNDTAGIKKSKTIAWLDKLAEMRENPEEIISVNILEGKPLGYDLADAVIYDGYRDADEFSQKLRNSWDCRKVLLVDEDTGEVKLVSKNPKKETEEKELKRAIQVGNRIFEGKVNLLILAKVNIVELMSSVASLGEAGREIAQKIYAAAEMSKEEAELAFDLGMTMPHEDAKYFFARAREAGVETRYVKTARSEAAKGAEGIDSNDWWVTWPDDMDKEEGFDEFERKREVFRYSYIEHKNCIWFAVFENTKREIGFYKISNFVIRPLYLIKSKTDPKRLFEIKNIFGVKYILDIPAKALVSLTEFQVFCESTGNFLFTGTKQQFTKIKAKLYDNTKDAEEVKMLGWQDEGFYAFANGAYQNGFTKVDEYGIIKHLISKGENEAEEKYFFIPAMSSIYKDEKDSYDGEKKFVYVKRPDVTFEDWSKLFFDTYQDSGVIGMAFYMSSLFRDMIYSRFKFFPHLFHFGPPGTGKSTMCWSIQYMYGLERKPFMLNAGTAVGFHRTFAQFRNAVVWFDEYNNQIEFKRVQDLKSAYDGAGHVKGEWSASGGSSNKTTTTPVESACNISGQELPVADNALFKRCILLQYHQTVFSDEEKERLTRLQKLQEKSLSHITGALTTFRGKMEEEYFKTFDEVEKEIFMALDHDPSIESRIVKNMAVIATTFKVLKDKLKFPYSWEHMLGVMVRNIKSQNGLISNAKETNQFWDEIDYCISEGELKDQEDYKVQYTRILRVTQERKSIDKDLGVSKKVLFIRLVTTHSKYMESLRKKGEKKGMDKGSLAHYLSHAPGFIGIVASTRFKKGTSSFTTSAYVFDYKIFEDQGYNFERQDPDMEADTEADRALMQPSGEVKF